MNASVSDLTAAVRRLVHDIDGATQRAADGLDDDLQALLMGHGGWSVPNVLRTAATCAMVKQLPTSHPDVALVLRELEIYGYSAKA